MSEDLVQQQVLLTGAYPLLSLYPVLGVNGLLTLIKAAAAQTGEHLLPAAPSARPGQGFTWLKSPFDPTAQPGLLQLRFTAALLIPLLVVTMSIFILKNSASFRFAFFWGGGQTRLGTLTLS